MIFRAGRRVGQEAVIHALKHRLNQEIGPRARFHNTRKEKIRSLVLPIYNRIWSPSVTQDTSTLEELELLERYQDLFIFKCFVSDSHVLKEHRDELKELLTRIEPRMASRKGQLQLWYQETCREALRHEGNASKLRHEQPKQWDVIVQLTSRPDLHDGSTIMHVYTTLYTAMANWIQHELEENRSEYQSYINEFNAAFRECHDDLTPEIGMSSFLTVVFMDQYKRNQKMDRNIKDRFRDLGVNIKQTLSSILAKFCKTLAEKRVEDRKAEAALKELASFPGFDPRLAPACRVLLTALNDKTLELKDIHFYQCLVAIFTEDPESIGKITTEKDLPELKEPAKRAIRLMAAAQLTAEGVQMEHPSVAERYQLCLTLFYDRKLTIPQKKCLAGYANRTILFANQANPRYFTNQAVTNQSGDKRKINQDNENQSKRIKDDPMTKKEDTNNPKPKTKNKKNKVRFAGDTQTPEQRKSNQTNGQVGSTGLSSGNYSPESSGSTTRHPPEPPAHHRPPYRGRGRGGNGYANHNGNGYANRNGYANHYYHPNDYHPRWPHHQY